MLELKKNNGFKNGGIGKTICLLAIFSMMAVGTFAQTVINVFQRNQSIPISPYIQQYVDSNQVSTLADIVANNPFIETDDRTPVFPQQVKSVWFKFSVKNSTDLSTLFLNIAYPNLSALKLYKRVGNQFVLLSRGGNSISSKRNVSGSPDIIFDMELPAGQEGQYILHVNSEHPIILPAFVSTQFSLHMFTTLQTVIIGLYLGMLAIMFFYNLFLFFSTKDINYLLYVTYIFFLGMAQITAAGYSFRYLWPNYTAINHYAVIWTTALSAIAGLVFSMFFLQTAYYTPKSHKIFFALIGIYIVSLVTNLFGRLDISYSILNYNSLLSVVTVLLTSIQIARKGFRAAFFYIIAWAALLLSFFVLILRNLNLLPYNNFTAYIFYIGSAVEVALLSIALADKINSLRKEKEISQAEALRASQENERLVREQNIELEHKVADRTKELQQANDELTHAYSELKEAQIQLVEAEKMASLGQLTAGIAHEINNPINFVKSNIKPLQLDFKDMIEVIDEYEKLHAVDAAAIPQNLKSIEKLKRDIDLAFIKDEISSLMKGIEEGAERTAEIVRGLRTFSRLDESQIKVVNIHDGIESTLVLLRSNIPLNIRVVKDYQADGNIECFPGKLNQVFMNIINNAIQAIKEKEKMGPDEFLILSTSDVNENEIQISIKDSGVGMTPEVRHKIFDPFFTTKDVGEGTGLGLAIVFKIIKEHGGRISVTSAEGQGSEFILTLPHSIPVSTF